MAEPIGAPIPEAANAPANVVAGIPDTYTKLLFLDNDNTHLRDFRTQYGGTLPNVTTVKVPSKIANEKIMFSHPDFTHFAEQLSASATDIFILNVMLYGIAAGDNYDRTSGINADIVAQVEAWIAANPEDRKAIGIDIDRTLTQFEGLNSPYGSDKPSFLEGYLNYLLTTAATRRYLEFIPEGRRSVAHLFEGNVEYFMGGVERLALIRRMFDILYDAGVDVYIITNNDMCYSQPAFVNEFLNALINPAGQGRLFSLVCSRRAPHFGNKRGAWRGATPRTHTLLGGRRASGRQTTRRNKHQTKKRRGARAHTSK